MIDRTGCRWSRTHDLSLLNQRRYHWAITILVCHSKFFVYILKKIFFPKLEKSEKNSGNPKKNCSSWLKNSENCKICQKFWNYFQNFEKIDLIILANRFDRSNPLHPIKFIPEIDMLFPCWNSQSFHLHTGGVPRFTTQAMSWTGSFRTFIVHGPWTGSKTVRILLKIE